MSYAHWYSQLKLERHSYFLFLFSELAVSMVEEATLLSEQNLLHLVLIESVLLQINPIDTMGSSLATQASYQDTSNERYANKWFSEHNHPGRIRQDTLSRNG